MSAWGLNLILPLKTLWRVISFPKSLISRKAARHPNVRIAATRARNSEPIWFICPDDWVQFPVCSLLQTICTSLQKKSAAWQSFASDRAPPHPVSWRSGGV